MRIKHIRIQNLRSFSDVEVPFANYTAFVGPNGAGKSTILCALNIFFREVDNAPTNLTQLDSEDFHNGDIDSPISITITFDGLNLEAQNEFAEYFRNGVLIVSARASYDKDLGHAVVKQYGNRMGMPDFSEFFKRFNDGAKANELGTIYNTIRSTYRDLPKGGSKEANRSALREYEEMHPAFCNMLPSEDQFYGFSKGTNRLAKFVQWIYIPAVKDATEENSDSKNSALTKLLERAVRTKVSFDDDLKTLRAETLQKYRHIIDEQQNALDSVSQSLSARLIEWAHPAASARVAWSEDPNVSVRIEDPIAKLLAAEGAFEGSLARFGHGLQRSYLLALLHELASTDSAGGPSLILGCEEPELYQHPPQARHLASVFQKLSSKDSQIVVSTHSPHFVSGKHFESVRLVRRNNGSGASTVAWTTARSVADRIGLAKGEKATPLPAQTARLHQALQPQLNELFFTPKLVLVEGLEDLAYITSWMILTERWEEYRRTGCHIVPVNGKSNLIEPLVLSQDLKIPTFSIFDADGDKTNQNERKRHEADNKALLRLIDGDDTIPFPNAAVWLKNGVIWASNLGDCLKSEVPTAVWDSSYWQATKDLGTPEGSFGKNTTHISDHLAVLHAKDLRLPSLDRLCVEIISFGAA